MNLRYSYSKSTPWYHLFLFEYKGKDLEPWKESIKYAWSKTKKNCHFPPFVLTQLIKEILFQRTLCRKRYMCEKEIYMLTDHVKSSATNPDLSLREN